MATIDELKNEYDSLFEKEKKLDEELHQLLNNQNVIDSKFNSLKSIYNNVQMIHKDSQSLSSMIEFTTNLADNVSSKVRQLDLAKSRVSSCIKRVTDILDLKACTDGVTEALAEESYEAAANHIHRYLKLDKDSLRLKNDVNDINEKNYLDNSFQLLQESKTRLHQIVNEKYDQAVHQNDIPQMERFFKIFPLIGLSESGLEKFATYLCNQINQAAENNFTLLNSTDRSESRWSIIFADALILLFEKVARMIEAYQPVIESSYGYGNMFVFIRKIQSECDLQSVKILNKFKETRNVAFVFRTVQQAIASNYSRALSNPNNSSTSGSNNMNQRVNEEKIDPRNLDELLTEITLISARSELYKNFLLKCIVNDLNGLNVSPGQDSTKSLSLTQVQTFINSTDLQCCIQELIGQYSILENYFMIENIYKAIQMDSVNKNSIMSSVVDDVFFIIKKCIKRCLCSDSVDGCCAMFNNSSSALESIYKDYFYGKLKAGYPSGFDLTQAIQRRFQVNNDLMEKQKINFLITLNNIDQSIEWIATIRKLFEDDISKLFVQESQSAKDKLASCLNDLNSVSIRFKELLEFGFNQLNLNEIRQRIKQLCEAYVLINHKINEDELTQYEAVDPFIQNFIKNIEQMILTIKESLSSKNQEIFTGLVASEISTLLEKSILKCSFSKYGGLQLDKEIRLLINYLASLTSWSTREKFARLSQIAILLGLESISELFEYWNSSLTIAWRLTPNEIRQILLLRADFRPEDIKSLKL